MLLEYNEELTNARFLMYQHYAGLEGPGLKHTVTPVPLNTFIYNAGSDQPVKIDGITHTLPACCILPLTSHLHFSFERAEDLVAWQFNREFYCILDHDVEVGCAGLLFYGITHPLFIRLNDAEISAMNHLVSVFKTEWLATDKLRGEMLRTLLKQLIIKCTRAAKQEDQSYQRFSDERMDIVRKFSVAVEMHFKKEHSVSFYARALNKSAKTLSNLFALLKQPAPSRMIRHRIILEAERYLRYTGKSAKEIAYELGFESPAHFSRYFKMYTGFSISAFKEQIGK